MKIVYPGTFDPVTLGHLDVIRMAAGIFDGLVVAVVRSSGKKLCFPVDERENFLRDSLEELGIRGVAVTRFDSLLVDFMRDNGFRVFIRGLRANSDFEYEFQMQLMNRRLAPEITGIYLMPSEDHMYISSTLVKEIAVYGGNLSSMVTGSVEKALRKRFGHR